ncbi:MAG TPA: enolase C-terminal domain-like protein [Phycisphaerae bacterium]|nr:enolase C-terminal domain-like protein [Phycisphaerae bacterium]
MANPIRLDIHRTAIPMRSFEHAAASRELAEAIVTRVTFDDGAVGWGETLPRDYVTGETLDTVPTDLGTTLWPAIAGKPVGPEQVRALPARDADGRCITAARCAMELALSDAIAPPAAVAPIRARVSGVLGSADPDRTARRLRWMRLYGLRDFKLKLGFGYEIDRANLAAVDRRIGRAIARGRCTLRVDVNGGWDAASAPERVEELAQYGVCAVEQPVYGPPEALADLAARCTLPLIADESLRTGDDARVLLAAGAKVWWNLRISKNGGLTLAADLARLAAGRGVPLVVGCMVGESGILSAAQRRLLTGIPQPRFVEGNYGRFLLSDDLTTPSPRFGYGGRLGPPPKALRVNADKLARYGTLLATLEA